MDTAVLAGLNVRMLSVIKRAQQQQQNPGAVGQGTSRFHVGPFSVHTTTLPDMAARSSAIPLGYWIGHLVPLVGSFLTCYLGALPGFPKADGICSRTHAIALDCICTWWHQLLSYFSSYLQVE
ncbi:hypothetical protein ABBQ38_005801 [Trebouxia sp. C0009 RCD-2024]